MSGRAALGPNLRRARIHHGISLEAIAQETKVPVALWEGLEDNNLTGWPHGIYARAYIREYAELIGIDAEEAVNEFCRVFPQGDRRQAKLLQEHAQIVGHDLAWTDDGAPSPDRRTPGPASLRTGSSTVPRRLAGALVDGGVVFGLAALAGVGVPADLATRVAAVAAIYYILHIVSGGDTPALRVIDTFLEHADSREKFARRL